MFKHSFRKCVNNEIPFTDVFGSLDCCIGIVLSQINAKEYYSNSLKYVKSNKRRY